MATHRSITASVVRLAVNVKKIKQTVHITEKHTLLNNYEITFIYLLFMWYVCSCINAIIAEQYLYVIVFRVITAYWMSFAWTVTMAKQQINTKSSNYAKDKEAFLKDLKQFNESKKYVYNFVRKIWRLCLLYWLIASMSIHNQAIIF